MESGKSLSWMNLLGCWSVLMPSSTTCRATEAPSHWLHLEKKTQLWWVSSSRRMAPWNFRQNTMKMMVKTSYLHQRTMFKTLVMWLSLMMLQAKNLEVAELWFSPNVMIRLKSMVKPSLLRVLLQTFEQRAEPMEFQPQGARSRFSESWLSTKRFCRWSLAGQPNFLSSGRVAAVKPCTTVTQETGNGKHTATSTTRLTPIDGVSWKEVSLLTNQVQGWLEWPQKAIHLGSKAQLPEHPCFDSGSKGIPGLLQLKNRAARQSWTLPCPLLSHGLARKKGAQNFCLTKKQGGQQALVPPQHWPQWAAWQELKLCRLTLDSSFHLNHLLFHIRSSEFVSCRISINPLRIAVPASHCKFHLSILLALWQRLPQVPSKAKSVLKGLSFCLVWNSFGRQRNDFFLGSDDERWRSLNCDWGSSFHCGLHTFSFQKKQDRVPPYRGKGVPPILPTSHQIVLQPWQRESVVPIIGRTKALCLKIDNNGRVKQVLPALDAPYTNKFPLLRAVPIRIIRCTKKEKRSPYLISNPLHANSPMYKSIPTQTTTTQL